MVVNPLVTAGLQIGWHSVKRTASVITTLLVIAGIAWAIYAGIIRPVTKPNPTTTQKAEQITNYNVRPSSFGCVNFRIPRTDKVK